MKFETGSIDSMLMFAFSIFVYTSKEAKYLCTNHRLIKKKPTASHHFKSYVEMATAGVERESSYFNTNQI